MPPYPSSHSPSLRKMNGGIETGRRGRARGGKGRMTSGGRYGIMILFATIFIAVVRVDSTLPWPSRYAKPNLSIAAGLDRRLRWLRHRASALD